MTDKQLTPEEMEQQFIDILFESNGHAGGANQCFKLAIEYCAQKSQQAWENAQEQDKNFSVRLKASIERTMRQTGLWAALSHIRNAEEGFYPHGKFFDAIGEITIEHLQGGPKLYPGTTALLEAEKKEVLNFDRWRRDNEYVDSAHPQYDFCKILPNGEPSYFTIEQLYQQFKKQPQ